MKIRKTQKLKALLWATLVYTICFISVANPVLAQEKPGDVVNCGQAVNFSKSPDYSSVDPLLLSDPSGLVHLFWAERITGSPDAATNAPDAVMYSVWNGETWSLPVDLFLSPREFFNRRINALRGVVDDDGNLHLTWIGPDNTFFYSSAHASRASQSTAWRMPTYIALDQSGSQYSADINFMSPGTLHIVYGRLPEEGGNHVVAHIRSTDGGLTWSAPQGIYTVPYVDRGVSNLRVWTNPPDKVYATWTEWDTSGNGQAIFFARSLDNGLTWEKPIMLAERQGNEYERDWVTLAVLGEDELVAFWEGGFRAYRQAQYSADGGATWSRPIDTLDWLIADNGFAEFVRDGAGRLHLFVFQRIREGNGDRNPFGEESNGLWHTVWEGETQWRQPQMVGLPNPGNFVTVAIRGGNELFAAWFSYADLELAIIQCELKDTPAIPPQPWAQIPPLPSIATEAATAVPPSPAPTASPEPTPAGASFTFPSTGASASNPGNLILYGTLPALFVIVMVTAVGWLRRRNA
ncbi:MAG: glycoside hydrolase [Anaerolineae bacterium]|nr:glycoside hydrolase [Anaerolineae bacterium]